jgi:hypothetical protein
VIMAEGLFHLKRNVCALIHAGSCYKIEGQFILKKILTTMHVLSILFSGKQIGNRKYILQWREFSVWEQVPVTR